MYKIYKLIWNNRVVYVGQTTQSLIRRKSSGYKGTCVEHIYKECSIELIEETDDVSRERYWIDFYRNEVLNILDGNGFDKKEYLNKWESENKKNREQYREKRKAIKKEYDRQRYLSRKKSL